MVANTKFAQSELAVILSRYGLGEFVRAIPLEGGSQNTNYRVVMSTGQYVLRYYELRSEMWALFEAELVTRLYGRGFPTPRLFGDTGGHAIGEFKGKPFALFESLAGVHGVNPNHSDYGFRHDSIARHLGLLHNITAGYQPRFHDRREGRDKKTCLKKATEAARKIVDPVTRARRLQWMRQRLDTVELPNALPSGVCHADCNFTNFLFDDETLMGVLDFDMACNTYLIYDLANFVYWWAWPPETDPDFSKIQRMTAAYQKERPLGGAEKRHLFDALKLVVLMSIAWCLEADEKFDAAEIRYNQLNNLGRDTFAESSFD